MSESSRRSPSSNRRTLSEHLERARDDARKGGAGDAFIRREMHLAVTELVGPPPTGRRRLRGGAGVDLLGTDGFNGLVRARYGYMLYNRNDIFVGRAIERYGEYSEAECALLRQLCLPGNTVVEVGANIGAHTLPLSQMVGDAGVVHAIEPQRIMFGLLCANVALNSLTNVHCHPIAVGARKGTSTVPPQDYSAPGNFGGVSLVDGGEGDSVPLRRLDDVLDLKALDLLKIDTEGMEYDVLAGARRLISAHRPVLYVENDRVERSEKLIRRIQKMGYDLFWHTPYLFNGANFFGCAENIYPNTVSSNLLCLPVGGTRRVEGLKPVNNPKEFPGVF